LRKLEAALGARLIERDARGCLPTSEGTAFLAYAESLLRLNARAVEALRNHRVAIGASSNIGIYLLQPYIKSYFDSGAGHRPPDIHIHQNPVIAHKLDVGEIDVAAMEWWDNRPGYVARPWRREELVAIVPPGHPWAALPRLPRAALQGVPLLGGEPGTGTGRILARYFGAQPGAMQIGMRLGSTEAVKQWVKAGLGVSMVLAGTIAEECREGTLVAIPLEDEPPTKELVVIWRDSLTANSPARAFGEWLAAHADG
jgi:DNA-binding transcriptional LysR family regulator